MLCKLQVKCSKELRRTNGGFSSPGPDPRRFAEEPRGKARIARNLRGIARPGGEGGVPAGGLGGESGERERRRGERGEGWWCLAWERGEPTE
uniref:Uncharacterized protein n=1 Tax=Arundo donax TaxID=35708 RepID=A0A0A9ANG9_ARUDO